MGRAPCCEKEGLKRGPWTPEEDQTLINYIQNHGHDNWRALPKQAGLLRCGKSCRLRWMNYLRPDIKRGNFSREEEDTIVKLHEMLGNRWSAIAAKLPGRTDNEIKNVWHTYIKKRLSQSRNQNQITHNTISEEDVENSDHQVPRTTTTPSSDDSPVTITANSISSNSKSESPSDQFESSGSEPTSSEQSYYYYDVSLSSEASSSSSSSSSSLAAAAAGLVVEVSNNNWEENTESSEEEGLLSFPPPPIDESFWMDVNMEESSDDFPADDELQFLELPFSPVHTVVESQHFHCTPCIEGNADEMGFWYNLFTAGAFPAELPDF